MFARIIDGLMNFRRVFLTSPVGPQIKARYESTAGPDTDGPATFLRQTNLITRLCGQCGFTFPHWDCATRQMVA